ncbi:MAG TPA: ribonuclease P protein subunit [Candidatus Bathyarchaeia archaeon]|nr:ribonuclease P protein subunit [Candidatus Bathyarchaeia archaeon]
MPLTPQNILAHEWIGLSITIKTAADPKLTGLSGIIRDETKNTFQIETDGKLVRLIKNKTTFLATLPNAETILIQGGLLRHRSEDRVKKGLAKW